MSARIKPSFEVDGKHYEFIFTRALQVKYQEMTDEKRHNSQYQMEMAEFTRLQENFETLQNSFSAARKAWIDDPLDKDKEAVYRAIEEAYKAAYKEFTDYSATHDSPNDSDQYVLKVLGDLTLLALEQQYDMSSEKALGVWNKFVEEVGQQGAMEWLVYAGKIWLTVDEEDSPNPFIQKMREKAIQADNRRAGLSRVRK